MIIFFEDGRLRDSSLLPFDYEYEIDAKDGYSSNLEELNNIKEITTSSDIIYTNSLVALDNRYCWNVRLGVPELYIRAGENQEFVRVDKLTNKELREAHNLFKMYKNGEFK